MSKKYAMNLPVNERSIRCDKVALKRMGALAVDSFLILLVILTPMASSALAVIQFAMAPNFAEKLRAAFAHDHVIGIAIILLLTPLPLIYWRLIFKVFMHSRTPGEHLMGVGSFCKDSDAIHWTREVANGLVQYFYLFGGLFFAGFCMSLCTGLLLSDWLVMALFFLILFAALYFCHRMQSEDI